MKNFRLQILLERTPLTEADKYNIALIFSALSFSRQQHILDNWGIFAERFITERKRLDEEQRIALIETLKQANTLLDEAILREKEKQQYKEKKKQETRQELESTVAYGQMQQLRKVKELSKI
jgi:hypothetical protein